MQGDKIIEDDGWEEGGGEGVKKKEKRERV